MTVERFRHGKRVVNRWNKVFETLHDNAAAIPDQLIRGCRRLEDERHE